jgi:dihydroorotate dehydrogenase
MTILADKPIIISPPFGYYYNNSRAVSVLGSYTLQPRPGRGLRIAQFVWDNLRHPVPGGYRNRIGLRNPGLPSISPLSDSVIYSLVGLEPYGWLTMLYVLLEKEHTGAGRIHVELNVSCPNVHEYSITRAILERFVQHFDVTVKLPPDLEKILPLVEMCGEAGVHHLHCSNTSPSDIGGLSGYPLKQINLPIVENLAKTHKNVIGGGGIYCWQDILDYANAGASYFSIATLCFHPIRVQKLIDRFYSENSI